MPAEVAIKNVTLALNAATATKLTQLTAAETSVTGPASYALVQNTSSSINVTWRDDGTDPTSAGVFFLYPQQSAKFYDYDKVAFISASGTPNLGVGWYA
jgi:hypothetical protein